MPRPEAKMLSAPTCTPKIRGLSCVRSSPASRGWYVLMPLADDTGVVSSRLAMLYRRVGEQDLASLSMVRCISSHTNAYSHSV